MKSSLPLADALSLACKLYEDIAAMGLYSHMDALKIAITRLGYQDPRILNTLVARLVGQAIEASLMAGHSPESAVRGALGKFGIQNEDAARKLIQSHEIELARIHTQVGAGDLIGIGAVGGAKDAEGKTVGAIRIMTEGGATLTQTAIRQPK